MVLRIMEKDKFFYFKAAIFILLLSWFGFFMAKKIDLTTADLGRHIKNGELFLTSDNKFSGSNSPLYTNSYSYTHPDYPVINHHWGSGIIFYLVWKLAGFIGLSLFYIALSLIVFSIFFRLAVKKSDFATAALLSAFLIPLMAHRAEVRPEIFSYFFAAVFFWMLWNWKTGLINWRWLFVLPALMVLWVNIHIYFFLGLFLIGVFLFSKVVEIVFSRLTDSDFKVRVKEVKEITSIFILALLASLLNPAGLKGAAYPFSIFKNYGYPLIENKSVWFVENYGLVSSNFLLIKIAVVLLVLSFVLALAAKRRNFSVVNFCLGIAFGVMACLAIRNFTLFGFFALPILACNVKDIFSLKAGNTSPAKESGLTVLYLLVSVFAIYSNCQFLFQRLDNRGIGLTPGNNASAEFFKEEKISGPIFNNYDIGGYLIFHLYPSNKVFVDNRPEAYPASFFEEIYKPMQSENSIWEEKSKLYNFNAIFFYRRDITPWGRNFLAERLKDPKWVPVFWDDYVVIFLKKNDLNQSLIEKYEISREHLKQKQ